MGITAKFKQSDVQKALDQDLIKIERSLINILRKTGEDFVGGARDGLKIDPSMFPKGDYIDRTSNLRSSIGYFVLRDSKIVDENLNGTATGQAAARATLNSLTKKPGYQLIGVAGMDYASKLESRGYNVISSQGDVALIELTEKVKKYAARLGKKGTNIDFDVDTDSVRVML